MTAEINALEDITVNVRLDDYKGKVVASMRLKKGETSKTADITSGIIGKHAVYFEFRSESAEAAAELVRFTFDR